MIEHPERTFVSYCSQRSHRAVAVFIPICGKFSWKGNNSRIIEIVLRKGLVHEIRKFLIRLHIGGRLHHGIGVATSAHHQGAFMRKNCTKFKTLTSLPVRSQVTMSTIQGTSNVQFLLTSAKTSA